MMFEPFKPEHLDEIDLDEPQRFVADDERAYRRSLANSGQAFTVRAADGHILACFGVLNCSAEHGVLWSYTSVHVKRHRIALHRAALRALPLLGKRQLQATTDGSGCRWLEKLGFHYHDSLPRFGFDGKDHLRYVRNF